MESVNEMIKISQGLQFGGTGEPGTHPLTVPAQGLPFDIHWPGRIASNA
jgi:hypothetical protein